MSRQPGIATMPEAAPAGSRAVLRKPLPKTASTEGGPAFRVEIFDTLSPLEADWRALEQDRRFSLHQSYDWCSAWTQTHDNPLAIVQGLLDAQTGLILPIEIVRTPVGREGRFIAAPHSNINTGLFSADFMKAFPDGLTAKHMGEIAHALRGKTDLLFLQNVPLTWRERNSPLGALPVIENHNRSFQLPLLGCFEQTLAQLNKKRRRKNYRRQTRFFDDRGGYEYLRPAALEEQRELLELFLKQKAARFKSAGLPDVFRDEKVRDFLRRLLAAKDAGDGYLALELHALRLKGELAGHIPAIAGLSRKGDHVICQFTSIDETLVAEASPGELLFWLVIEHLHHQTVALFDFGIGDQRYKRSWCPIDTTQHDAILPISARGHLAALARRSVTRSKAAIKANPRLYGLLQRLRARGSSGPCGRREED